jgi:malonyl-CoA decarboxylase
MVDYSFLGDLLQTVAERGRRILAVPTARNVQRSGSVNTVQLCEKLLSRRGEVSGMVIASQILDHWDDMSLDQRRDFILSLRDEFGPNMARLRNAIRDFGESQSANAVVRLHAAAEPRRQELVRRLNLAPSGTARLVKMRAELLKLRAKESNLAAVDADFLHLLSSWFNRGFLSIRRIDWSTPAGILEKIIHYEAVHAINDWSELRRRLAPPDRRCYGFFHPQLPDEPLIFVEVALTQDLPSSIALVLDENRSTIAGDEATTAVFYSISNCQAGLKGITFGNFLIKQVVQELRRELPGLREFATLSPVTGFSHWLRQESQGWIMDAAGAVREDLLAYLESGRWVDDSSGRLALERFVTHAVACYLLTGRNKEDRPADAVARFHLGNGARLERINFGGDLSPKAISSSCGVMVNYKYVLDDIERNHEAYAEKGEISASAEVLRLARSSPGILPKWQAK